MLPMYYVLVSLKQWNVQVQCMVSDVAYRYVIITGDLNNDNNNSIRQSWLSLHCCVLSHQHNDSTLIYNIRETSFSSAKTDHSG